ncbi:flavin reductase [Vallitalea pronyensis]|uniref:Flavin reductase n=1 Tax=Vallitalea pronyensis TaxID=1348613 RepID=A0A8J8SI72_9FIRM|nr:flavin reductase [Vallitalea pronyensis]QUI24193.1 flavin reductase [Vallitalea pronyensis]
MNYEHNKNKPDIITEDWPNQYTILPWMSYLTSIPHVIFMVTTLKENGLSNAALHGWASFSGEGNNYYIIMPVMKHSHTYQNIKRDNEFCVNFLSSNYVDLCKETIAKNAHDIDELTSVGFTPEKSKVIKAPRIKESFLKLECTYEWEKELCPNSINVTVCAKVNHISANESFVTSAISNRYGHDSFMFHLMAMKNPYTGERIKGGIGRIELTREMEL